MDSQINYYLKALSVLVVRDLRVQGNWIRRDTDFASGLPRQGNERHRLCQTQCEWRKSNYLFILRKLILIVSPGPERASIN